MNLERLEPIYLTMYGSHAYGLATEESDIDHRGIFIAPREYLFGFLNHVEQITRQDDELDSVIFELRKFFKLAAECNPSTIEILFTEDEDVISITPLGEILRGARRLFLSKKIKHTFGGYANQQLRRIRRHQKWLQNPPTEPPTREEFGLPDRTLVPRDQLAAAESMIKRKMDGWSVDFGPAEPSVKINIEAQVAKFMAEASCSVGIDEDDRDGLKFRSAGMLLGFSDNFMALLEKEKGYKSKQRNWKSFQDWKKNRNPDRAKLEAKFGYDTKHALHLVRLMRMAEEILTTGEVLVRRPDREELLAIRREGAWSYDELVGWAERKEKQLDELVNSDECVLPRGPNRKALDRMCIELVERSLKGER